MEVVRKKRCTLKEGVRGFSNLERTIGKARKGIKNIYICVAIKTCLLLIFVVVPHSLRFWFV